MKQDVQFGDCCGLRLNYGFWGNELKYDKDSKRLTRDFTDSQKYLEGNHLNNTVIVLRHEQKVIHQASLDKGGWRLLHEFWNPNTWCILYLYFRDVEPTRAPGNPAFEPSKWKIVEKKSPLAESLGLPLDTPLRQIGRKG